MTEDTHRTDSDIDNTPVLTWSVHLVRKQPEKLAVIVPMFLGASYCAHWVGGPVAVLIVALVLLSSLSDFLFPVHYTLTRRQATCKRLLGITEIQWSKVRHCYLDDLGVKLSPLPRPTRLEAYRGVYLRFHNNKDQVIDAVRSLRPSNA